MTHSWDLACEGPLAYYSPYIRVTPYVYSQEPGASVHLALPQRGPKGPPRSHLPSVQRMAPADELSGGEEEVT